MPKALKGMKVQEIQTWSSQLASHPELFVSALALEIAAADLRRDAEFENKLVEHEAKLSTASAKEKVLKAENRRLKAAC